MLHDRLVVPPHFHLPFVPTGEWWINQVNR